ncbi:MAG: hypothetical protein JEZ14_17475 [Marinilabiliaceae bacterium]|nr:hypothetical protein [Marinilabiliaceae bacterium]
MKQFFRYTLFLVIALGVLSCEEEESLLPESVITVVETHHSELDQWIFDTFTQPYNIEIKWKWDDGEVDNNFHVIPPQKEKAEAFLKALLEIWIKPYEAEAGTEFIKTYSPKLIFLVGTPQYNADGTMTVGLAEGGRKVTVFDVNSFNPTDLQSMTKAFHTMHHEFAHIMHQKVMFSTDFKEVCKGDYTGAWYNVDELTANIKGFITPYSMSKDVEDWVEIVAAILTHVKDSNTPSEYEAPVYDNMGAAQFDEKGVMIFEKKQMSEWTYRIHNIGIGAIEHEGKLVLVQHPDAVEGRSKLLTKLNMVQNYYQRVWNIDLIQLQKRIENSAIKLIEENKETTDDE